MDGGTRLPVPASPPGLDHTWLLRPVPPQAGPSVRRVGAHPLPPSRGESGGLGAQSAARGHRRPWSGFGLPRPRPWPAVAWARSTQRWARRTGRRTRREGGRRREASPALCTPAPVAATPRPVGPGAGVTVCAPGSTPDAHHPARSCAGLTGAPGAAPRAPQSPRPPCSRPPPPRVPWALPRAAWGAPPRSPQDRQHTWPRRSDETESTLSFRAGRPRLRHLRKVPATRD